MCIKSFVVLRLEIIISENDVQNKNRIAKWKGICWEVFDFPLHEYEFKSDSDGWVDNNLLRTLCRE